MLLSASAVPRRVSLPVLHEPAPAPRVRASRAGKWRTAVLVAVHLLIAAHIAHWLVSGRTITPVEPSEAMAYSKGGIVNAGLIFFAAAILLTAVFGRWFCGWACHLVALQDGSLWLLKKMGIRPKPLRSRLLAWVPLLAFAYMFLWPAAYRIWRGDSLAYRGSELTTGAFWATFPGWVVGALTFLVCGFVAVYFLGAKGFCTYACPYGAAFSFADRFASLRVRVTDACQGCGHCTSVCTSNVRVHEEVRDFRMVVDPGCMKCGDCVSVCPNDALYFGWGKLPALAKARGPEPETRRYPLSWGEELFVAAIFLVAFAAFRGLFGYVPFLMSLGLAGSMAFVALVALRLARRPSYAFRHRELRRDGKLSIAGRLWLAAALLLAATTVYAASLQLDVRRAGVDYDRLAGLRARTFETAREPGSGAAAPGAAEREALDRASTRYERVARLSPVGWLGLDSRLAWIRFLRGESAGFSAAATRAVERGDAAVEMLHLAAIEAADRGDAARAIAALEALAARGVGSGDEWATLASRAGAAGRLDFAGALLGAARNRFPDSVAVRYNSAVVAALQNQPEQAAARFREVLAIDPEHREARENLAGMLAQSGRFDEAADLYADAIARAPGDVELRLLRARALAGAGRTEEALETIRAALEIAPSHAGALALRDEIGGTR